MRPRHRQAQTDAQPDRHRARLERLGEQGLQRFGDRTSLMAVGNARHDEFRTARARDDRAVAERLGRDRLHPRLDPAQQHVACGAAVRGVDEVQPGQRDHDRHAGSSRSRISAIQRWISPTSPSAWVRRRRASSVRREWRSASFSAAWTIASLASGARICVTPPPGKHRACPVPHRALRPASLHPLPRSPRPAPVRRAALHHPPRARRLARPAPRWPESADQHIARRRFPSRGAIDQIAQPPRMIASSSIAGWWNESAKIAVPLRWALKPNSSCVMGAPYPPPLGSPTAIDLVRVPPWGYRHDDGTCRYLVR